MTCELLPNAVEFSRVYFSGWRLRMLEILYYLLPNMDKMNIKLMASYGLSPEFGVTASTTLYCLLYLLALLCLAIFIFEKREY